MFEINGTLLIIIISFSLFVLALNYALWEPIRKIKDNRYLSVNEKIKIADQKEKKSKKIKREIEAEIQFFNETQKRQLDEIIERNRVELKAEEMNTQRNLRKFKSNQFEVIKNSKHLCLSNTDTIKKELSSLICSKLNI